MIGSHRVIWQRAIRNLLLPALGNLKVINVVCNELVVHSWLRLHLLKSLCLGFNRAMLYLAYNNLLVAFCHAHSHKENGGNKDNDNDDHDKNDDDKGVTAVIYNNWLSGDLNLLFNLSNDLDLLSLDDDVYSFLNWIWGSCAILFILVCSVDFFFH